MKKHRWMMRAEMKSSSLLLQDITSDQRVKFLCFLCSLDSIPVQLPGYDFFRLRYSQQLTHRCNAAILQCCNATTLPRCLAALLPFWSWCMNCRSMFLNASYQDDCYHLCGFAGIELRIKLMLHEFRVVKRRCVRNESAHWQVPYLANLKY